MAKTPMTEAQLRARGELPEIHPDRLFTVSCIALTSGSMMFAILGDIRLALKQEFILTNEEVGMILWAGAGFTVAIFVLGPLCDAIGMKWLLRLAFVLQMGGAVLMMLAEGAGALFFGILVNALGSGAIEAVCNPLVATIYPDKKTHKLSQFHMWFPGGIVIGGVACYVLTQAGMDWWRLKVALVLAPTLAYGLLFLGQDFPVTERVQSGISFQGMVRATFLRPLFLLLLFCMLLTASLELGPMGWIPAVLQAGGIPGILVLVWVTGLMAVLRYFAGPVVRVLTNTGVLLLSAVVAGLGLYLLSVPGGVDKGNWFVWWLATRSSDYLHISATVILFVVAASIFAVGVCYFWPTMLGTVAERVPKGGALALAIMGGTGSLFVTVVTTPLMGHIADSYLHQELVFKGTVDGQEVNRAQETAAVLKEVRTAYADWGKSLRDTPQDRITQREIKAVLGNVDKILVQWQGTGVLPAADTKNALSTANTLRMAIKSGPPDRARAERSDVEEDALAACKQAEAILNPADNKGGLLSFRFVAPVSLVLIVIFGIMCIRDRRRGGYKPERIGPQAQKRA